MLLAVTEDDDPVFAELKHIVAVDVDRYYFVVTELDTVRFHGHFHSYEVVRPTGSTNFTIVQFNRLADPHPLGLYKCTDPVTHHITMLVSVKYHYIIMLN